jgi:hypothetical protein
MSSLVKGHVHTKAGMRLPFFNISDDLRRSETAGTREVWKRQRYLSRVQGMPGSETRKTVFFRSRHSRGGAPSVGAFIGEDWRSHLRTHAKDLLFAARTDEYTRSGQRTYVIRRPNIARRMTSANLRQFAN